MAKSVSKSEKVEAMVHDHEEIEKTIKLANMAFDSPPSDKQIKVLRDLISILKDRLDHHFRLEEDYGILHDLVDDAPRIECDVKAFYEEHRKMAKEIDKISGRFEKMTCNDLGLCTECKELFIGFVKRLGDHESRENELIMDVYNMDIGGSE